nr:DarT ssDNA thymidine ADP-ribosyltransferase family protein [Kribbella solani]
MHFTTHQGLLGILATGLLKCRDELSEDEYLEHIYTPNCSDRLKDADWTGYVNLSISRVNADMFKSSKKWHLDDDGVWWAILVFDATLLAHAGITFATTNNVYPVVQRGTGLAGLQALFNDVVPWGYYGSKKYRSAQLPDHYTTDPQAEVLYPRALPVESLRAIYVYEEEDVDAVEALLGMFPVGPQVNVEHRPEVFQ